MKIEKITTESIESFLSNFDEVNVWPEYQETFQIFWKSKIMNPKVQVIDDSEIDPIIRMLDLNAKGNTKGSIVIAKAFIRMGMWYRAFRSLKSNGDLCNKLDEIFLSKSDESLIRLLDEFYALNKNNNNGLSGKNAVILNAILCLNNPSFFISAVSLDHRNKIINFLYPNETFEFKSFGENIINTNRNILDYFKKLNPQISPRKTTIYLYTLKELWDNDEDTTPEEHNDVAEDQSDQIFVIEKYFEDFLIGNWESTDLGDKYDLIFENGELKSQQFKTDIGYIDLLVKEKNTGEYVVIELKRSQTSDTTVGQIMRYIGWVKNKLSPEKDVKGIIIGYSNDEKLNYAISCVNNVDIFLYRIKFSLIKPDISLT